MNIFVSPKLSYIKDELIQRGYNVVDSSNAPYDVIICDLKNEGISSLQTSNSIKNEGVLIIDIGSKNIDEIEYILDNRVYSSLF